MDMIAELANRIGVVMILLIGAYASHKGWIVTGREMARVEGERDDYKTQLKESNAALHTTNETNAKLAALVPGLIADRDRFRQGGAT